jgi:hypothetical protein
VGAWLCLHYLFVTFENSIGLSLITLHFYKKTFFPIETTIRNALKGGKPDRKPYTTPMVSEIHTKQSANEENSSLFRDSIL